MNRSRDPGTTLIAAETTGRVCWRGTEPAYVDVAIERWQESFTGRAAMLAETGRRDLLRPQKAARGMNAALLPAGSSIGPVPPPLCPECHQTHDADQVAKIAASMAEFGWTVPCPRCRRWRVDRWPWRVLAAAQLGLAEAPVIVLGHLTEAQRRAYRIADNKLTELGGWDALLLEELRA